MFSSKMAPSLYILIFKEHMRHIYNDLKIKHKNSQVYSHGPRTRTVVYSWSWKKIIIVRFLLQITTLVPG